MIILTTIKKTNTKAIILCLPSFLTKFFNWYCAIIDATTKKNPPKNQYPIGILPEITYKIAAASLLTIIKNILVPDTVTGKKPKDRRVGLRETPPPSPTAAAQRPTIGAQILAAMTLLVVHLGSSFALT